MYSQKKVEKRLGYVEKREACRGHNARVLKTRCILLTCKCCSAMQGNLMRPFPMLVCYTPKRVASKKFATHKRVCARKSLVKGETFSRSALHGLQRWRPTSGERSNVRVRRAARQACERRLDDPQAECEHQLHSCRLLLKSKWAPNYPVSFWLAEKSK